MSGDDLISATIAQPGSKIKPTSWGAAFAKDVLGQRAGVIYVNKDGDSVSGLTVKNGAYSFELEFDDTHHRAWLVKSGTYIDIEKQRYEELLDRYFTISDDASTVTVYELKQSGSGAITSTTDESGTTTYNLNGGYRLVNGGYLFVDNPASIDANSGILYMVDRAVVVTASGNVYPIAIEGNAIEGDISQATITFSPNMEQMKDVFGNLLYKTDGAITTVKTFNSIPVYNLRNPKTNDFGEQLYYVYNIATGQFIPDPSTGEPAEFTAAEANILHFSSIYQKTAIYQDVDGLCIVRPLENGGFSVTYTDPGSFTIPRDSKGYGIISQDKRILLADEGEFAAGTVLYLDDNQNINALLTPDGKFYRYEQDTFYTPDNADDAEIYAAYRSQGSAAGKNLDLIAYLSADSQTMLHEVMSDLYMAAPDNSSIKPFGLDPQALSMSSFYRDADYFAKNNGGQLVLLNKVILDTPYEPTGAEDAAFAGAAGMNILDLRGKVMLTILELSSGVIVFLFDDNTWINSKGETGFIPRSVNRTLDDYDSATQLRLNRMSAADVNLSFAGAKTTLTDNGGDNINITADNVVITAEDGGNIFTKDNPLSIAANKTDTVNLRLVRNNAGGAYDASAYLAAYGSGDNVNLHDTIIAGTGLLDLAVAGGDVALNNVDINQGGTANINAGSGGLSMNEVDVSGTLTMTTGDGDITMTGADISGTLTMASGNGDITANGVDISGTADLDTGSGDIALTDLNVSGTLTMASGDGDITANGVDISGTADLDTGSGDISLTDVDVSGTAGLSTDSGDISLTDLDISGTLTADTLAGDVYLQQTEVNTNGSLAVSTGQGNVTIGQLTSDGTLQITALDGNLLMEDEDSILTLGKNSTIAEGHTWVDIGGDIGSAERTFIINILPDKNGAVQPFVIKNAANIYLQQETGISIDHDNLPTSGRDENGQEGNHDQAANEMADDDETVNVTMPAQTPEELAAQLNNGNLNQSQLLALISGKLNGAELKELLALDDEALEALIQSLQNKDAAELALLVASLGLGVEEIETRLDLTALDSDDADKIAELAQALKLSAEADKDAVLAALRSKLSLDNNANIQKIKNAYATYYSEAMNQYRSEVMASYRAGIEDKLNRDSGLNETELKYLLDLGLGEAEAVMAVLLTGALQAQSPVQTGVDGEGNPIYEQATDEEGNPIYREETDENGDIIQIPVYVMESRIADGDLFASYWKSLSETQKQALIEAAWELAAYPEPKENELLHRVLILQIGQSTGQSQVDNMGDIIITQANGTFTAAEVTSAYGDVTIKAPSIAGVANKTNIYGNNISLTAASGSITGLNVDEVAWPLTTIGNITDQDKFNEAYGNTGSNTWMLVRNPLTGEIEMKFAIDYTAVIDLDVNAATNINATAAGDIEINEIRGNMGINVIDAGGSVILSAPGSIYNVRPDSEDRKNITAGNGVTLSAGGTIATNQDYLDIDVLGTVKAVAGQDININAKGNLIINSSGDLILIADSSNGQVNVNVENNLTLSSDAVSLKIGYVNAGGTAIITSAEGIIAGDKLGNEMHIWAPVIILTTANGSVGAADNRLAIDTAADGSLAFNVVNGGVWLDEVSGDLFIVNVTASGDGTVNITSTGAIKVGTIDSTGGGAVTLIAADGDIIGSTAADTIKAAADAQAAARQARSAADLAAAQTAILQNYVDNILPKLLGRQAAQQALDNAKDNLDTALQERDDLDIQIPAAQAELANLQTEKTGLEQNLSDAQDDLAAAQEHLDTLDDPDEIAAQKTVIAELSATVKSAQTDLNNKQAEIDEQDKMIAEMQAQRDTLENDTIPELTQIRDDAQTVLDDIDAEIAQAQIDLVDTKAAEWNGLETTATTLEASAADLLSKANGSGISSAGDLNLSLLQGGTVGQTDNALGITADGTVSIAAGEGKTLTGLYLTSGGDLYLAPVVVDGQAVINSAGDIKGAAGSTATIITADATVLNSLGGDIGAPAVPLLISVDRITANGQGVYIKNLKNLIVDTITGSDVNITTDGDISAGTAADGSNNIVADQLSVNAGGDVGSGDNHLTVDTGELNMNSNNLYMDNNSGDLTINQLNVKGQAELQAAGNVKSGASGSAGSGIKTGGLKIEAFGNVGDSDTDPLAVNIANSNNITSSSQYGAVNLKNTYQRPSSGSGGGGGGSSTDKTLTDKKTGLSITGAGLGEENGLLVSAALPYADSDCPACAYLNQLLQAGRVAGIFNVSLTKPFTGTVTVDIPVGTENNGKTLTILAYQDGKISAFNATVTGGMVSFTTETLGTWVVLNGKYTVVSYAGAYTIIDGQQWPMAEGRFADVNATDYYFPAIAYLHALKIMVGVSADRFEPKGTTTRAMLAMILYRLAGSPDANNATAFTDVPENAWYAQAINWAAKMGYVKGYGDNIFGSEDLITREQLAVVLYRYTQSLGKTTAIAGNLDNFKDRDQVSDYAEEALKWAVSVGLIHGKGESNLDPAAQAARAEIATIIYRYLELYPILLLVDESLLAPGQ